MYSVFFRTQCLILLLALTFGCNSKPSTSTSDDEGSTTTVAADGTKTKKSKVPIKRNVETLEGNWVVVMTNQRTDSYIWLIKFAKGADGKIAAEFLDTSREKDEKVKPQITATEVNGNVVRIVMKNESGQFDYVGVFQDGFIRGTIRSSPKDIYLTRLLPTDEKTLERFSPTGLPPATDVFEALFKSKDAKPDDIFAAIVENRTSPLAQDMYAMLMAGHIQANLTEAKLKELIDSYLSAAKMWGERWVARVEVTIAAHLINGRKFTYLAPQHLDAAEAQIGEDHASIVEVVKSYRDAANTLMRIQDLSTDSTPDEQRATAFEELTKLLKNQRYNAEILFTLATEAERTGNDDLAMQYLSEVVALPMLEPMVIRLRAGQPPDTPTPTESLKKLWTKKTGNESEDDFIKYVDGVYQQKIGEYLAEIQKPIPAAPAGDLGNRVVLVELFTGMQCPPCVGTDLAVSAIGKTYPTSEVIVISHHQHVPGPDGLVNQDSEERGAFYETGATPTVAVDGIVIDPRFYAGPIQITPTGYAVLRKVIDPRLAEKTEVALEISAAVKDGQLHAAVTATGIPDDVLPSCRLRMAIVENLVRTVAPMGSNGIRDHEHVVREMLGGAKGIPSKKGELKYSISMPIADVQDHVVDYIKRYETGRRFEFPKPMKPPIQGALSLVAWVQNDKIDEAAEVKAKVVLQSAIVPITGFTLPGSEAQAATVAPSQTDSRAVTKEPATTTAEPAVTPVAESTKPAAPEVKAATNAVEQFPPPPSLPE